MFIGRIFEINTLNKALNQTKNSNPTHLLFLGERGIGKTSFLNVAEFFARGEIDIEEGKYNFLSVRLQLNEKMCLVDLAIALKKAIEREICKENAEIAWLKKTWNFLNKFEVAGIAYKKDDPDKNDTQIVQDFIYSIIDTVKSLKNNKITKQKDGLVILLDEADKASKDLNLGSFLKNLSESLMSEGENNVLFIITGLPNLRDVLLESHESSLRLFQELNLKTLSKKETSEVINAGLKMAEKNNHVDVEIDEKAQELIYEYSEGYPHFIQQIGYSAFETDSDNKISEDDVKLGFFQKDGALELIGDRYFANLFYKEINTDLQREILTIMSENWNGWTSREEIKKEFSKKETDLSNSIRSLIEKGIIIPKEGSRGQYRLQWGSFAFWIKNHDRAKHRK